MKDEVESQLSAMFDGELPAAECELLSRRIDRDERLRARWARYVLIGASMRYEPVATASATFATGVSSALAALDQAVVSTSAPVPQGMSRGSRLRTPGWVWQSALAAGLVVAVAGLSIAMLRNAASSGLWARQSAERAAVDERQGASATGVAPSAVTPASDTPWSYVTPSGSEHPSLAVPLRSELADYIVAHSEYSAPLMRPDLLSALVSGEQGLDDGSADRVPSAAAATRTGPGTGEVDAPAVSSPAR